MILQFLVWSFGLLFAFLPELETPLFQSEPETVPVWDGTLRQVRVPVLMYHYVSPLPEDADAIREGLTVDVETFAGHVAYLDEAGYTPISLYDLHAALQIGTALPEKPVILTFDDGHLDHYTNVFPILQEYGFTATFFIITARADANDPEYMTWEQISEMAAAGMSMEPHTKNHLALHERGHDFLVYEMLGSIESLKAHTGIMPRMFSYPAGRYDEMTLQVAEELGIWLAVTTLPGMDHTTDGPLELRRVRVNGDTGVPGLAYLLRGTWLEALITTPEAKTADENGG